MGKSGTNKKVERARKKVKLENQTSAQPGRFSRPTALLVSLHKEHAEKIRAVQQVIHDLGLGAIAVSDIDSSNMAKLSFLGINLENKRNSSIVVHCPQGAIREMSAIRRAISVIEGEKTPNTICILDGLSG